MSTTTESTRSSAVEDPAITAAETTTTPESAPADGVGRRRARPADPRVLLAMVPTVWLVTLAIGILVRRRMAQRRPGEDSPPARGVDWKFSFMSGNNVTFRPTAVFAPRLGRRLGWQRLPQRPSLRLLRMRTTR